ncbi:hypothetical protein VPHG_00086 [Vibrio phage 11895-B1]|uniref:hypothetical protein n=1 Tax=Vibrio phage 11895-B1 TaxID=754075 RepID=UPI0002C093A8|nr:hypothetical protein VPHG_00086 [Vibrio phage 11895-B1]AGH32153.1 hypothetical protein VPHG_00086 [Vibrio phage 11895-B1]
MITYTDYTYINKLNPRYVSPPQKEVSIHRCYKIVVMDQNKFERASKFLHNQTCFVNPNHPKRLKFYSFRSFNKISVDITNKTIYLSKRISRERKLIEEITNDIPRV